MWPFLIPVAPPSLVSHQDHGFYWEWKDDDPSIGWPFEADEPFTHDILTMGKVAPQKYKHRLSSVPAETKVVLIDTPGFGDTTLTDSDIWKTIAASFVTSHRTGIHFTGIIYMQRISDVKVSGLSRQYFRIFQELCGEEVYPNVFFVTTNWDAITPEPGHSRYQELATKDIFFKPVLEKGRKNDASQQHACESALEIIRNLVDMPPVVLRIQRELGGGVDIMQTSVYKQIRELMSEMVAQRQKKLDTLIEEMAEAERDRDEETQEELQEEVQAAKVELQEAQDKTSKLASEYQVELRRIQEILRRRRRGDIYM
ncbi:hypothetical protein J3R82DRAFT_10113 [Butyriboletus roseoflavus]|nr:hypothetical protein J3R82DRAFT_10113 [Butyriboletus roseoflavus]